MELSCWHLRISSVCRQHGSPLGFSIPGDYFSGIPPCFPLLGLTLLISLCVTKLSPVGGLLFLSFIGELRTLSLRPADVRSVSGYDVGYDECYCTTDFVTPPGRLDIAQSKQHTFSTPPTHHWATLSLRPADVGSIGEYDIGYDECFHTTDFATAPGRLYIAKSKQHTLSTPPTPHWTTSSLRPADVGIFSGYNFGYDECSCTTNFATAPGRLDIAQSKQHMLSTPPTHHRTTLSLRR